MTYRSNLNEIAKRQNFSEFYSRHFSGKISPYLAALFVGTKVTPNHLTVAMIPAGIVGGLLASTGNAIAFIVAGLFLVLLNILDAADGELARFTNQTSLYGDYLDRVAHYITNLAMFLGVGMGLYLSTGQIAFVYVIFVVTISTLGDEVLRDLLVACRLQQFEAEESRKSLKKETKLVSGSVVQTIFNVILSNVAFFHLVPVLSLIDFFLGAPFLLGGYFVVFSLASCAKFVMRFAKIGKAYG